MRTRRIMALAVAGGMALGVVGASPAGAHGSHRSCKGFGEALVSEVQELRPFGQTLRENVPASDNTAFFHDQLCLEAP